MSDAGLRAKVRTAEGWAVGHAVLTVTDAAGTQVARAVSDGSGWVRTDPLPPGVYTAVLTAAGHDPVARTARVGADGSGSLGELVLSQTLETVELPPEGPWVIDPAHSSVMATARHLGIASVKARFPGVSGMLLVSRPVEFSSVRAEIDAASVDTGLKMRDDHLRSADFLDVDRPPTSPNPFKMITFVSTGLRRRGADSWRLSGALTLHGEHRDVELDLRYGGFGPDPWGGVRAAFHAETELHRDDFAINYHAMVRAGIAAVGATIRIELDIEAVQGDSLPEL